MPDLGQILFGNDRKLFGMNWGNGNVHIGAAGTPDYGITEKVQQVVYPNKAYASSGGSNLFGGSQAAGDVLGTTNQPTTLNDVTVTNSAGNTGGTGSAGTPTGTPTGDPNAGQPSGPSEADLINSAYDSYFKSLDDQMNSLGGYQQQQEGYIGNQYNEMAGQSENALKRNENQLAGYETEATQNKATSIRDIGQDLMNSLQAGQIYLGTMGAGSSSAVGRMSEALSKAANRRTTDVSNQTNKILADINTQKMNLKSVYDDEMSKLRQWKNDSINQVAQWVQGQRQSIMDSRGRMDFQRAQEVNNFALQKLQDIQAKQDAFSQGLQEWALSRSNNIAELQKNMTALGSFNVPGLQYTNLSNQYTSAPTSGAYTYRGMGSTDDEKKQV